MFTLSNYLIRSWYYCAQAFGITAYKYDARTGSLQRQSLLYFYCISLSMIKLFILPFYYSSGFHYFDMYEEKPLLNIISRCNMNLQCITLLYHIVMGRRKDRHFCRIVRQLRHLEMQYFARFLNLENSSIDLRLFYAKYATFCYQSCTFFLTMIALCKKRAINLNDVLHHLYFLTLWNYLHVTIFAYFLILLYCCKRFCLLHKRLRHLFARNLQINIAQLNRAELVEFRMLLRIHRKLQSIIGDLNRLFSIDVIAMLLLYFMGNCVTFYMCFIFATNWHSESTDLAILLSLIVVQSFDMFLMCCCCEELLLRQRDVVAILREWQHLLASDEMCESFSLNLAVTNFRINIYGMFDLDKRRAFAILRTTIMHTIILIQFDYIIKA